MANRILSLEELANQLHRALMDSIELTPRAPWVGDFDRRQASPSLEDFILLELLNQARASHQLHRDKLNNFIL